MSLEEHHTENMGKRLWRTPDRHQFALSAVLIIGAVLRLWHLDRTSLWYDEAVSWSQSNGSLAHLVTSVASDNYPPLHNLLLWLTMPVLGDTEFALRLPSAVAGIVSIWLIYELGKLVFDQNTGLLAALLLALSPFHIWFSTEARMYALFAFTGLAFLIALFKTLQGGRLIWPLLTAFFGAAFLYSHIYATFAIACVGSVLLLQLALGHAEPDKINRKAQLRALAALLAATCLFLPWLVILATRAKDVVSNGFWIATPDWQFLTVMVRDMAGSEYLFLALVALCLVAILPKTQKSAQSGARRNEVWLLAAYCFGSFVIAYALSILLRPILFDRYLIASWPVLLLLSAAGASRLGTRIGPIALMALTFWLTAQPLSFTLAEKIRPQWRDITYIYIEGRQDEAPLLLHKGFALPALTYYLREQQAVQTLDNTNNLTSLLSLKGPETWLLFAHSSQAEMDAILGQSPPFYIETGRWRSFGWGESGLTLIRLSNEANSVK
ncbi:glycosyltransferase family 39 protein [Roseibium algae]|uniref:Glycosyltransferase family 39 protein n=1 Tax=Roseibium algae TaxID=3123038 RepID=A0ABU8TKH9_9HYPH